MPELIIDGKSVTVPDEATVLDACREAGVAVPTLCHLPGYTHHTSCMVCLVRDARTAKMLPSCSTPAAGGMVIEACGPPVEDARRAALELLLSEHVGDCEGPCRRVCPQRLDIPGLLRLLAAGRWDETRDMVLAARPACTVAGDCKAPCERACRRGLVDAPVSIRLLVRSAALCADAEAAGEAAPLLRNVSTLGSLRDEEKEALMTGVNPGARIEPAGGADAGFERDEVVHEAGRCMHCDCRKALTCRLRIYSDEYGARQGRYAGPDRRLFSQVRQRAGAVYEPGKCIKCGKCVRITERAREPLGLAFIGRGFDIRVGVPFDESLGEALKETAQACVDACPTGALAWGQG